MSGKKSLLKSLAAYEKIREMILSGAKLPGTRLVLTDLEKELKIGRGPIREALLRLDRSGIVKNIPYKGAIVANHPKFEEIVSIFEMRVNLEVKMAVDAMHQLDQKQIKTLEKLYEEMNSVTPEFYCLDRSFHDTIYKASRYNHLYMIDQKLIQMIEAYLNMHRQKKDNCILFNRDHFNILEAIKNKDEAGLKSELETNIGRGLEQIKETYANFI